MQPLMLLRQASNYWIFDSIVGYLKEALISGAVTLIFRQLKVFFCSIAFFLFFHSRKCPHWFKYLSEVVNVTIVDGKNIMFTICITVYTEDLLTNCQWNSSVAFFFSFSKKHGKLNHYVQQRVVQLYLCISAWPPIITLYINRFKIKKSLECRERQTARQTDR